MPSTSTSTRGMANILLVPLELTLWSTALAISSTDLRVFCTDLGNTCGGAAQPRARAASKAAATANSFRSAPWGATICTPTGSPDGVVPAGTEMAGQPVTVMKYADRIQSR